MVRLEIPALYRLDIGHSKWGWHKMSDLTVAVNNLIERSVLDSLTTKEIGNRFAHLNSKELFAWSDETDIYLTGPRSLPWSEDIPWSKPNLFVPAQWSMSVIDEIKRLIAG